MTLEWRVDDERAEWEPDRGFTRPVSRWFQPIFAAAFRRGFAEGLRRYGMLLDHFDTYAKKDRRYRPINGCKIPQKFIGFSDHGYYLCWHQGRNITTESLIDGLKSELARDIVREGMEKRCVACNCFNYSWDDEWNRGIMASAESGQSVETGVVALRVPSRLKMITGGSESNTLDIVEI